MVTTGDNGFSPAARRQLEKELADLRAQRDAMAPIVGEQERTGDAADQAEVLDRAEAAAYLDRRISDVAAKLEHGGRTKGLLPDGTTVTLRFAPGDEDEFHIVTIPGEDSDAFAVTSDSPLGLALVGAKEGDDIKYRTPRGEATATVVTLKPPA
ncbi:GreA/GreB family elongation factor [Amycolatopsis sp. lyj-112]|uniref:GreA/GreB family elongation factor n=1 Tax=Amycolatopsis sp. lyj-112 TaxID=2789288 RepID=UPI00397BD5EB